MIGSTELGYMMNNESALQAAPGGPWRVGSFLRSATFRG